MILGILPTISDDHNVYLNFLNLMEAQTLRIDLLAIGFQGDEKIFSSLRESVMARKWGVRIEFIHIPEKSLARSKNILINALKQGFSHIFIYEDDVVYNSDYNELMLKELLRTNADMISAIVEKKATLKQIIYSLFYTLTHIPPLNDMRSLLSIIPFGVTIKSRYLSGGMSMAKKEVFDSFSYDDRLLFYSLGEDVDFSFRASSAYKTVITNKIKCIHNSHNVHKFGSLESIIAKINLWSYFFDKNIHNKFFLPQLYCIFLLNLAEALLYSLREGDMNIIKAALKTFILNRRGLYTSPFIEGYTPEILAQFAHK